MTAHGVIIQPASVSFLPLRNTGDFCFKMPRSEKSGRSQASSSKMTLDTGPEQATGFDARFQTAGVSGFEQGKRISGEGSQQEEEGDDQVDDSEHGQQMDQDDDDEDEDGSRILKPLSKAELEAFERKQKKRGVIYISHIPHGMTVAKVKHLLEGFGEVDRIFLHDGSAKPGEKRESGHFSNVSAPCSRTMSPFRETYYRSLH